MRQKPRLFLSEPPTSSSRSPQTVNEEEEEKEEKGKLCQLESSAFFSTSSDDVDAL